MFKMTDTSRDQSYHIRLSIYPNAPVEGNGKGSLRKRLMKPSTVTKTSHFLLVFLCCDRPITLFTYKHYQPSACARSSNLEYRFCFRFIIQIAKPSLPLKSYIWAWEVSSGWEIQGNSQQFVPQDRDEVLGHDLLLFPCAMVFQR